MLTPFASIIRIALRLLLSSVAMFSLGHVPSLFFAVTLIVYRICQVDGTNYRSCGFWLEINSVIWC